MVEVSEIVVGKFVVSFFVNVGLEIIVSGIWLFKVLCVMFCNRCLVFVFSFLVVYIRCVLGCISGLIWCSILLKIWLGMMMRILWLVVSVVVRLFLRWSVLGKGILGRNVVL